MHICQSTHKCIVVFGSHIYSDSLCRLATSSILCFKKCMSVNRRHSGLLINDLQWSLTHSLCLADADGKTSVKFGVLFNDDQCANLFEALVGTLKAAKRKKVITFDGELLLQGVHDNVDVVLLQDWMWPCLF